MTGGQHWQLAHNKYSYNMLGKTEKWTSPFAAVLIVAFLSLALVTLNISESNEYIKRHQNVITKQTTAAKDSKQFDETTVPICTSQERLSYIRQQLMTHPVRGHLSLVVQDERRVAYCYNKKVASATLWRLMYAAGSNRTFNISAVQGSDSFRVRFAKQHAKTSPLRLVHEQALHTVAGHRMFAVVRNPFDRFVRFVSAYSHMILSKRSSIPSRGLDQWLRGRYSNATLFQRFTRSVLEGYANEHWVAQTDRCDFKLVQYDDIVRMESFRHDLEPLVTNHLRSNWDLVLQKSKHVFRGNKSTTIQTTVTSRHLPIFQELTKEERRQLKDFYSNDFKLLGYDFDLDTLIASCRITTAEGKICC